MGSDRTARPRRGAGALLLMVAAGAGAQFVPPAGFSGRPGPGVAADVEPGAPALTRIPDASLAARFHIDRHYHRAALTRTDRQEDGITRINSPDAQAAPPHVTVVGAFAIAEPAGARLREAWGPGFLPVTLRFGDDRCYSLSADYSGGTLSNGRLRRTGCDGRRLRGETPPPAPRGLRLVGSAWGYAAWADDRAGMTVVTAPNRPSFEPLFTARMTSIAILAMNGIDWPGGNVTLVGRIGGRLMAVTLDVGY